MCLCLRDVLVCSIRRAPEYEAYQASKSAAVVVQKHARTFRARRAYIKKRDDARFQAQVCTVISSNAQEIPARFIGRVSACVRARVCVGVCGCVCGCACVCVRVCVGKSKARVQ